MSKWIEFDNHILKKVNIDFFRAFKHEHEEENIFYIECNFHRGMEYRILIEEFTSLENAQARVNNLQRLLGIIEG